MAFKTQAVISQLLVGLAATAAVALAAPAKADSTKVFCSYSQHDHTIAVVKGPCKFSQRGTNTGAMGATVYVTLEDGTELFYDGRKQGIDFERTVRSEGIWLNREGDSTLVVMWQKPTYEPAGY